MFGAKRKFSALSEYFEIDPNATLPGCWGLSVVDENIEGREGRSDGSGSFSSRCPRQSGWALRSRGRYHAIKGVDAWSTYGKPPSDSFTPAVFCADKWPNRMNPLCGLHDGPQHTSFAVLKCWTCSDLDMRPCGAQLNYRNVPIALDFTF